MNRLDPTALVNEVADFVNAFGIQHLKQFVEEMGQQHWTLQQSFTRLCFMWIDHLAEKEQLGQYDLRNEASCKMAKKIVDEFGPLARTLPWV